MNEEVKAENRDLKNRTKSFSLRVMNLVDALPKTINGRIVADQLVRSATSVGANYRAACRGRSRAEFNSKLRIVIEEADECCYWLEIIIESKMIGEKRVEELLNEANELTAIFVSAVKTSSAKS